MWNHTLFAWEHILWKAEEIRRAKQNHKRRNHHFFPHCFYYLLFLFLPLQWLWPLLLGPRRTKGQPLMGAESSLVLMGYSKLLGPSFLSTGIPKQFRAGECCLQPWEMTCSSLGTIKTNNNGCVEHSPLSDHLIAFSIFSFLTIVANINFKTELTLIWKLQNHSQGFFLCELPSPKAVLPDKRGVKKKGVRERRRQSPAHFFPCKVPQPEHRDANYLPRTVVASDLRLGSPFCADTKHLQL